MSGTPVRLDADAYKILSTVRDRMKTKGIDNATFSEAVREMRRKSTNKNAG